MADADRLVLLRSDRLSEVVQSMDRNGLEMSLNSRPIVRLLHPMFVCQYCRKLVLVRRTAYNRPSRDDRNHTR